MNKTQGKIILTFESDWHIGTGAGIPGNTDRLIFRDSEGFPAVPAKTLNGIWRDAMETLTLGLDNGDEKNKGWQKWVEFIFGNQPALKNADPTITPKPSKLTIQPARISGDLRAAIGNNEQLKQALTFIKAGIAIDNKSGTTKKDHLRFEEMGRGGTVLEAEFELQTDEETAKALLTLSAQMIERIGGKRRRGAGKCQFWVDGLMSKDEAIKHLENFKGKPAPDVPMFEEESDDIELKESSQTTEWKTLEYRLTLQTPVSIVKAVLGNVSESLDFIPGTYLLPHITEKIGKHIRSAVANGDFQVSPATIEINGERGFPVPKVLAREKMDKSKVYNRLIKSLEGENQTKPIREGYISDLNSNELSIEKTPQTLLIHNTVDDSVQRPTENVGGVFSREAIKAETTLRGTIRWRKEVLDDNFDFTKLNGYVRLGTSKKDDYGLAHFEVIEQPKDFSPNSQSNSKELVVYLASDVLLRNDNLRQTNLVEDLAKELSKRINLYRESDKEITLSEKKADEGLLSSVIQVRRIESWQTSWGFPRPTLTAMEAGSVVVFTSNEDLNLDDLKKIEAEGIGERRGEGYGQIVFNPKILETETPGWRQSDENEADENEQKTRRNEAIKKLRNEIQKTKSLENFVKQIELMAWHEELKVAVLKIAADEGLRKDIFGFEIKQENDGKKSKPPMSQIGGLRSVISRLQGSKEDNSLSAAKKLAIDWLKHLAKTENRRKKWAENKEEAETKLTKIKTLIENEEKIWSVLESAEIGNQKVWNPPKLLTGKNMKEQLWAEAVRALFYACQHAHKRDLEKNSSQGGQR